MLDAVVPDTECLNQAIRNPGDEQTGALAQRRRTSEHPTMKACSLMPLVGIHIIVAAELYPEGFAAPRRILGLPVKGSW